MAKDPIMIAVINDNNVYAIGTNNRYPSLHKFIVSLTRPESAGMSGLWVRQNLTQPLVVADLCTFLDVLLPARCKDLCKRTKRDHNVRSLSAELTDDPLRLCWRRPCKELTADENRLASRRGDFADQAAPVAH